MINEGQLAVLKRLATAPGEAATRRIRLYIESNLPKLEAPYDYETVSGALDVLKVLCAREPETVCEGVTRLLKANLEAFSNQLQKADFEVAQYEPSPALVVSKSLKILSKLRYHQYEKIVPTAFELAGDPNKVLSKKASNILEDFSKLDMHVVQHFDLSLHAWLVDFVAAQRTDYLISRSSLIVALLSNLLATEIEGTTSDYQSVAFHFGNIIPSEGVIHLREQCIGLAKRLFTASQSTAEKRQYLGVLNNACRSYFRNPPDADILKVIEANTIEVLSFYQEVLNELPLSLVEKVEHDAYWTFYHSNSDLVRQEALKIEKVLSGFDEYNIFKTLIGFEGIWGQWQKIGSAQGRTEARELMDRDVRAEKVDALANEISEENWPIWKDRIVHYASVESNDLATFPNFYDFIRKIAHKLPNQLASLFLSQPESLEPLLIAGIGSLWETSERERVRFQLFNWVAEGRYLYPIAKSFLSAPDLDLALLAAISDVAEATSDMQTLSILVSVAAESCRNDGTFNPNNLFLPVIEKFRKLGSGQWASDIWYRQAVNGLVDALNEQGIETVLSSLVFCPAIGHEEDRTLTAIAQKWPGKVLDFFATRNSWVDDQIASGMRYEAIPYQLYDLAQPLSQHPEKVIECGKSMYDADPDLFRYRGGKLVRNALPDFEAVAEPALKELLKSKYENKFGFLKELLVGYDGNSKVFPLCKALLKEMPAKKETWHDIYFIVIATGVVTGEYGLARAYEAKTAELTSWLQDSDEKVRKCAEWLVPAINRRVADETRQADEEIALRKLHYGEKM